MEPTVDLVLNGAGWQSSLLEAVFSLCSILAAVLIVWFGFRLFHRALKASHSALGLDSVVYDDGTILRRRDYASRAEYEAAVSYHDRMD